MIARDPRLYLTDILHGIESIEMFVERMEYSQFQHDDKTYSAVIRKFEVMGEAANQVPDELRGEFPQIPWKEMAGMRDRLIHFYFGFSPRIIWQTVKNDLPQTKLEIQTMLEKLNAS